MSKQKKFNIFITVAFIVLSLILLSVLGFSYFHFNQMKDSISDAKLRTAALTKKAEDLKKIEKDYLEIEDDIGVVDIALPSKKEASKMIKDLETLANQNGLSLISLRAAAGTKKSADLNLTQTVKGKYSYELPLEVSMEGPYQSFVHYIESLENYLRLNNISGFSLNNISSNGTGDRISAKLKITVYLDR